MKYKSNVTIKYYSLNSDTLKFNFFEVDYKQYNRRNFKSNVTIFKNVGFIPLVWWVNKFEKYILWNGICQFLKMHWKKNPTFDWMKQVDD